MKKVILAIFTIATLTSCKSDAQNSEEMAVKSALQAYINAGDVNDVKQLEPHLHTNFRVVLYDKGKDDTSILDRSTYISFIDTKKFGGYKREVSYEDVAFIEENMATVKVTLTSPGKPTLKNFYSLVNVKNKWLVIQDFVVLIP